MKNKLLLAIFLLAGMTAVKAQDCEAIVLPYFKGDVARMERYKSMAPEKFEYRCAYARAAFYESDTVPAGVEVYPIERVQSHATGEYLPHNYVVDLFVLSYYAYNFYYFQTIHNTVDETVCFTTPGSAHPYLVVRSLDEIDQMVKGILENH